MAKAQTKPVAPAEDETAAVPAVQQSTNPALSDDDFFGINTGLENVDAADVSLPRWTILQGMSPQVNNRKDEYIEGAQIGMLMNTASGQVVQDRTFVFAAYERRNIEWVPREAKGACPVPNLPKPVGGGLYKDYGEDDEVLKDCVRWEENGSLWTPRGNQMVVTGTWYAIDVETMATSFLAMGNTQFTSSKKLMAGIRDEKIQQGQTIKPAPLFYRAWTLNSRLKKDGDREWFVWQHKPGPRLQEMSHGRSILNLVQEIQRTVNEGKMVIDVSVGETEGDGGYRGGDNARM